MLSVIFSFGLGGWTSSRLAGLQENQSFGYPIELCSVVLIVDTRSPQPRRTGVQKQTGNWAKSDESRLERAELFGARGTGSASTLARLFGFRPRRSRVRMAGRGSRLGCPLVQQPHCENFWFCRPERKGIIFDLPRLSASCDFGRREARHHAQTSGSFDPKEHCSPPEMEQRIPLNQRRRSKTRVYAVPLIEMLNRRRLPVRAAPAYP